MNPSDIECQQSSESEGDLEKSPNENEGEEAINHIIIDKIGPQSLTQVAYENISPFKKTLCFICFCFVEVFYAAGYSQIVLFYPPVALEHGLSASQAGLVLASLGIGGLISSFFYGCCLRLFRRRTIFVTSNLLAGLIIISFPFLILIQKTESIFIFCSLWQFTLGFVRIGIVTLAMSLTAALYPTGIAAKYSILVACMSLGSIFGPGFGALLYGRFNFFFPFFVMGGVLIVNILIFLPFLPKQLDTHQDSSVEQNSISTWKMMKNHRIFSNITVFLVAIILNRILFAGFSINMTHNFGISDNLVGYYVNIVAFFVMIYSLVTAKLSPFLDSRLWNILFGLMIPGGGYFMIGPSNIVPYSMYS